MKKSIVLLVCFIICLLCYREFSRKIDYWSVIGVGNNWLYNSLVECKGNPNDIEYVDDGAYVVYDGVKFYYTNKNLNGIFLRAEVYDDTYTFGKAQISVGTTKEKVISFYKKQTSVTDLPGNELAYVCDDKTVIWFMFDDTNVVNKIMLTRDIY